jgi:hypothetical protein
LTSRLRPAAPRQRLTGVALLLVAIFVAACGATTGSGSPAASGAVSPASSADVVAPGPTSWPGPVIEAVLNLAKADSQIQAAGVDLANAAGYEDLNAMWGAADGLVTLLDKLVFEVSRIKDYTATSAAYRAYNIAIPEMESGARELRDAIKAGNAAGVTAGTQRLASGLTAYADCRKLIGPLADQAVVMQKLLSK